MGISLLLQVVAAPMQHPSMGNLELVMLATSTAVVCVGSLSSSGDASADVVTALVVTIMMIGATASGYILYQATRKTGIGGDEPVKPDHGKPDHSAFTTTTTTTSTSADGGTSHNHHAIHLNLHVPGKHSRRQTDVVTTKDNTRTVV
jgi:hypothetical protein